MVMYLVGLVVDVEHVWALPVTRAMHRHVEALQWHSASSQHVLIRKIASHCAAATLTLHCDTPYPTDGKMQSVRPQVQLAH
jgi:hypothetical protein